MLLSGDCAARIKAQAEGVEAAEAAPFIDRLVSPYSEHRFYRRTSRNAPSVKIAKNLVKKNEVWRAFSPHGAQMPRVPAVVQPEGAAHDAVVVVAAPPTTWGGGRGSGGIE